MLRGKTAPARYAGHWVGRLAAVVEGWGWTGVAVALCQRWQDNKETKRVEHRLPMGVIGREWRWDGPKNGAVNQLRI